MKKNIKRFIAVLAALVIFATQPFFSAFAEQNLVTEKTPLLDKDGYLTNPGYCFTNLYEYDRSAIKTPNWRTKEWDFYQICNDRYVVQVTIADISLGGAVTIGWFDTETGDRGSTMMLKLFTNGKMNLCTDDYTPHSYHYKQGKFDLSLDCTPTQRVLKFTGKAGGKDFTADLIFKMLPQHESHVIAIPFDTRDGKHFYLNQKTNCMETTGTVKHGDTVIEFKGKEDNSFCVLDWGRGVWPYHQTWWWGNGSTVLENGDIFGFELGWGFGDTSKASESTLFLNGKAYKIGYVSLANEKEVVKNWTGVDWKFTSDDGTFEMTMKPKFDNFTMARVLFVGNLCHQVFGSWSGTVKCGDKTIEINDMTAFCERSDNMW